MKRLIWFFILGFQTVLAQEMNTEVYLVDLKTSDDQIHFENLRNISNNPGYDNQPAFQSRNLLLYVANNEGQTDIVQYSLKFDRKFWLHRDSISSQYSPQPIPGSQHLTIVHLKPTGYQRLFRHHLTSGTCTEVHPDLRVAYYALWDEHHLLASVLGDRDLYLVWTDLRSKKVDTLLKGAGRAIHNVPGSDQLSYTSRNEQDNLDIFQFDPENGESYFVTQLPVGVQDHLWLDDTRILLGSGSKLFLYDPFMDAKWLEVADFSEQGITNISRMAVSPDLKYLALVAEPLDND